MLKGPPEVGRPAVRALLARKDQLVLKVQPEIKELLAQMGSKALLVCRVLLVCKDLSVCKAAPVF